MTVLIVRHLLLSGVGVGVLLLVVIALRLLSRRDAVLRYRLMVTGLVMAAVLLPMQAMTAELTPRRVAAAPIGTKTVNAAAASAGPECCDPAGAKPAEFRFDPIATASSEVVVGGSGDPYAGVARVMLGVYLAGVAAVMGVYAVRAVRARRLLRRARPVTDGRVRAIWMEAVGPGEIAPELLECEGLHATACRAIGRAAVIVPGGAGCERLDDDTLMAGLRHELIHLRRRDGWVALAASGLGALLWFQPVVWVFVRMLASDRELSCDALVVRATGRARSYALALLEFCGAETRRVGPLMGFESSRSVQRRITMLVHALQPVARRRHAVVLGVGVAALAATSAAHALLVAAAGPGPALDAGAMAGQVGAVGALASEPIAPLMTAEVKAPAGGRSDPEVLARLSPNQESPKAPMQAPKDGSWAFFLPREPVKNPNAPGTWVTDQETVFWAEAARVEDGTLRARVVQFSLPEGSKLRAVFEGETVSYEPGTEGRNRVLVTAGSVRLVDDGGVTRLRVRALGCDRETLALTSTVEAGEFNFQISARNGSVPLSVEVDTSTGVPEKEEQPPHKANRWKLLEPREQGGMFQMKMQWIYDLGQLQVDGC